MALRAELDELKNKRKPNIRDYQQLLNLSETLLDLLWKERKAKSSLNKKNRKLARRLGLIEE
jgi:predicted  nucleic acid-binding Zn-ribbon protein